MPLLIEAKADIQKLIDFAGEELANRYLAVKHKFKAPGNDLYYWIKNYTPEQFRAAVLDAEMQKSNRQKAKEADSGAILISETEHWRVYEITTFAASQKYGRDSQWCITGVNGYGDRYWKQYSETNGVTFYFLITKDDYDPRGRESKFAVAVFRNGEAEIYDQQDERVSGYDIPNSEGIDIPGVDLDDIVAAIGFCELCDQELYDESDINYGPDGEYICESCYEDRCFTCESCSGTFWLDNKFELPDGDYVCEYCFGNSDVGFCDGCGEVFYFDSLHVMDNDLIFCDECYGEEMEAARIANEEDPTVNEAIVNKKLTEAKADLEKLINFAGEDLANRFLAIKSKFKYPENDLYYWIKNKSIEELSAAVSRAEAAKSNRQRVRDMQNSGAELVNETEHWRVYKITTFEAAQYYGRDTKWCITGINDWGDKYWLDYTDDGVKFYFLITKDSYDPRGLYSKVALAIFPDGKCEIYNQRDGLTLLNNVPFIDEVSIPGVDLYSLYHTQHICYDCNKSIKELDVFIGLDNNEYCEDCFKELFCVCDDCEDTFKIEDCTFTADGRCLCDYCKENADTEIMEGFMSNFIDSNGNTVRLNSPTIAMPAKPAKTFKDRFIELLDYYSKHLPATVTHFEITDIIEDAINALFYITEKHQIGKTWHERKVLAALSKNNGQPEPWVVAVYKDKILESSNQGHGYDQLLKALSKVITLPVSGTAEYDRLRESKQDTFADGFSVYENLWN